jgi:hypothetical protein
VIFWKPAGFDENRLMCVGLKGIEAMWSQVFNSHNSGATAMKKKVDMTSKRLAAILTQHGIDKGYWPGMKALVFYGKRPADELRYRLKHVGNYVACLKAILTELSEAYWRETGIKFPPKDWQPACRKAS